MAIPFYNQGDQDIYESGEHYIPQEQYRLGYTHPPSATQAAGAAGITGTQAASPYIWPPQGGGGGDFKGGIDKYPHLDTTKTKDFYEKVWTGNKWDTQHIQGFYDTVTGNWKTKDNKNIQHAGLEVPGLITGFLNKVSGKKFGEPQIGDIKGTFTPEGEETEEEKLHKIAVLQKMKEKAYIPPTTVKGGGQDVSDIPAGTTGDVNTLGPNNPLIGQIDHTGGGITRDPGSVVEGAPTHSTRDDLMAQGGRIGYANGEFVDEDINIQGPGFDVNENIEMASGEGEEGILQQLYVKYIEAGFPPDQAEAMAMQEFEQMAMGPEQDQGIASLV